MPGRNRAIGALAILAAILLSAGVPAARAGVPRVVVIEEFGTVH